MIDTTAINYGLNKLGGMLEKAAPHIQNVSEEYVKFTVIKTVAWLPIWFIFGVISLLVTIKGFKLMIKEGIDDDFTVVVAFATCAFIASFICLIIMGYHSTLALTCPEMYTIHEVISSNK